MFGSDEAHKMIKPNSRRRVLKPPGGGSSDIFGSQGEVAEPQRKTKTHHLSSSLSFGGEDTVTAARNRAGNDSFYNLFGTEPQYRPSSAITDKLTSIITSNQTSTNLEENVVKKSINFDDNQPLEHTISESNGFTSSQHEQSETNGVADTNGSVCDECQDSLSPDTKATLTSEASPTKSEVSPVSEAPSVNGTATTNSSASTPAPTPTAQAPAPSAARARVPPGGFSSGLW